MPRLCEQQQVPQRELAFTMQNRTRDAQGNHCKAERVMARDTSLCIPLPELTVASQLRGKAA